MKLSEWKLACPYGMWTCADGREVLFNRSYWPILERGKDLAVRAAKPGEWIPHCEQEWFFDDSNPPWSGHSNGAETLARINAVLADWALPTLSPPPKDEPWDGKLWSSWEFVTNPVPPRANPWTVVLEEPGGMRKVTRY